MTVPMTISSLAGVSETSAPTLVKIPMTLAQFEALGETHHTEYYDGTCVVNPPLRPHVRAQLRLRDLLTPACPDGFEILVEWGWHTSDSSFRPDVMVVPLDGPVDVQRDPPLLIAEVMSPSNRWADLVTKRQKYAEAGLPWYWIVDLDKPSLTVLRNIDDLFVELQTLTRAGRTVGPLQVDVDPAALTS
jgi:Uma2 family endonuclease